MEGAKLIIEEINREAEQKIKYLLNEANAQAEQIKKEAEERAKSKAEWIIRKAQTQAEIEKQRIIANAKLEARKKKLQEQEKLINEVFESLKEKLASMPEDEYLETLKLLILDSLRELEVESVKISSNEKTLELLKSKSRAVKTFITKNLGKKVNIEFGEPINTIGGVLVKSEDGSVRVDNTFEARIERMKSELRAKIAKAIFG
ncbi:hypothetical protein PAP_09410 [Palaeococcus pacificus DY20341]|uniref:A-type ATP synthase subunit E n=1 Tax=Palaeococcus pacificus DY20341 TaxID=1343739 RepID=A0A075M0E7_9EURY|nr:V-type ATP synthase subunit E [Palaeococcus pacificus]AIF70258.1 hypothetical protein PAP_09410 [Palaeococcus pacificus DY20341]